ncbi:MAG: hypothetical protein JO366_09880 [Methylobacteriaceae bacterium]|nr:hypothetical protein [Methylobacteriaceae bacterium]MBV9220644.1 hypothetical protein [Methylobacteriaceae bacterium]MBV9245106.1 hypothetical protein [Methylobacteriaceae bacterium]MBV9634170.1 hypothetical protein [Methylobacteriaceae bacterium]MBV9701797.1 hypothetical protein [Methylobacteriaceae bacterium]
MWRLLHIGAIGALMGSAVYAYSVKYQTIWYAEQIVKMKHKIAGEHDQIAMLRAEWAHLTRPERVQQLVSAYLETLPLALNQMVKVADLPERAPKVDTIGRKLETLGVGLSTSTPRDPKSSGGTTPSARR